MPDASRTAAEFGLFIPVVPEEVPRLHEIAESAARDVSAYLRSWRLPSVVEPREEFGITVASKTTVARCLGYRAASFDVVDFVEKVNDNVRPLEDDKTIFPLDRRLQTTMNTARRRSVHVAFASESPAMAGLQARYDAVRDILWREVRMSFPTTIESPSLNLIRLGFMRCGDFRSKGAHGKEVTRLTRSAVVSGGIGEVSLGRMVIGTSYNQPLPGAEWPPNVRA